MAQIANENYSLGYGCRFSIRRIYDCVILVTFSSVGECSDNIKGTLMAKAIGAIMIAEKLFDAKPPKNFKIDFMNMQGQNGNVDCVVIAFALSFEKMDDVADYIVELKVAQIIS